MYEIIAACCQHASQSYRFIHLTLFFSDPVIPNSIFLNLRTFLSLIKFEFNFFH